MDALDSLYWVFKSKNPVQLPDAELDTSEFMATNQAELYTGAADDAQTVTLSFVGDILRTHRANVAKDEVYAQVADLLFQSDISVANYESPVTTQPLIDEVIGDSGPPTECASEEQFEALTSHHAQYFDVLNLANNHILDMGAEGLETTLKALKKRNILQIGIHEDRTKPLGVKIIERKGITFGFASCTFGTNGHSLPDDHAQNVIVANLSSKHEAPDTSLLKEQITEAKKMGCDLVVAVIHWGHEFELFPRREQQEAAQELAEFGADIIVCHHPHVAQPIELYRTKTQHRIVPIAYSLGSLLWGYTHEAIASSVVLQISVRKSSGDAKITDVEVTPIRWHAYENGDQVFQRVERR